MSLEHLTRDYWLAVQRVRRLPMGEATRARILADLEVLYRRERARQNENVGDEVG